MVEYRPFGRTGVQVSSLTLGAMNFSQENEAEGVRVIHRALDEGINIIDTADVYTQGESEQVVGKALQGRRDDVFLATKFHGQIGTGLNTRGNSRRWIITEVENSLRRLNTDWIDLYQVHRPDPSTDFDDTLGALSDLVHQGKIRYLGTSTFDPSEIVEGQWTAERRGRERVASEQPPYSILVRGIEREVLPVAQRYNLAVIPWSPLAGGYLSGRYSRALTEPISPRAARLPTRYDPTNPANAAKLAAVEKLQALADEAGLSLIHLALAFVLNHPAITSAIIGPRTVEHLESQLEADKVTLTPDILDRIDEIVPPGTNLNPSDVGHLPPSLTDKATRRR
ncbi:aryl-alcohol dehydrogenase-like predicted oxidoreductase [Actinoplanes tereljensis]|uniref:Aldo/keto reductase n=1 Tax=Paractinoplanes tereljensis TaxID=571912 RepID=A0A919NW63_9ACTN|nr:aldo/keto reductase [Actinoplanes tereljensis]GIF25365.1 aldo/keto reductase [Actinoplanes tereljensis]